VCFTIAAGPRQRIHSLIRVPWDLRPYFTVSGSRLPFFRLLQLAGLRWRYSTPPPHEKLRHDPGFCYITSGRTDRKHLLFPYPSKCLLITRTTYRRKRRPVTGWFPRIHLHGNVFIVSFTSMSQYCGRVGSSNQSTRFLQDLATTHTRSSIGTSVYHRVLVT
jgi:hypothetical protein